MQHHHPGPAMTKICKPSEPPKIAEKKPAGGKVKTPPPPLDDDDYEDGDIATPKRDRYGPDDEPL
jgi:hypothetical protein